MADIDERKKYVDDSRIACKYGAKCYQKNPVHLQKYKHPPAKRPNQNAVTTQPKKKFKVDVEGKDNTKVTTDIKEISEAIEHEGIQKVSQQGKKDDGTENDLKQKVENMDLDNNSQVVDLGHTSKSFDTKEFIKEKFLVNMPDDFYQFWEFCKTLKEKCPQEALKDVGLTLVGPYDVLAGKFFDIAEQPADHYLIHWRYYYDPPECQTILKGDDRTGHHIGYYRDSPKEIPVFLVNNLAKTDGVFNVVGDNIFAAVYLYLEDLKKTGDPFKKMHVGRFQTAIKKKSEELQLNLAEKTDKIRSRDKKIVTKTFSKIGIVVPYNRKTQVGYRNLEVRNKDFIKILNDIQNSEPAQRRKYLSILQNILTNVDIATDECDFGTGIELGLNILAHGADRLNHTISRLLCTNYKLMDREEFAKISEAHMNNRKKGTNLSIV